MFALLLGKLKVLIRLDKGIQWNPFIIDTIVNQHFVPYSELRGFWYIFGRHCMRDWAVEPNMAAFWNFPLLYTGREG